MRGLRSLGTTFKRAFHDHEFRSLLLISVTVIITGSVFYHFHEGWSWIDSVFFSVATLTTIGYGTPMPTTTLSKAFTIGFIFVGLGLILALLTKIAQIVELSVKD